MPPRDSKEIQIDGHSFIVKTYASAREANAIQQAYFKGTKVEVVGDQPKISEFNPGIQQEVEKELISQMVLSLDGTTDNMVERCLDFPNDVYADLVSQLDALVSKKKK